MSRTRVMLLSSGNACCTNARPINNVNIVTGVTNSLRGGLGWLRCGRQARLGVTECASHELLSSYPVMFAARGAIVAHFRCTVLLLPSGTSKVRKVLQQSHRVCWRSARRNRVGWACLSLVGGVRKTRAYPSNYLGRENGDGNKGFKAEDPNWFLS